MARACRKRNMNAVEVPEEPKFQMNLSIGNPVMPKCQPEKIDYVNLSKARFVNVNKLARGAHEAMHLEMEATRDNLFGREKRQEREEKVVLLTQRGLRSRDVQVSILEFTGLA